MVLADVGTAAPAMCGRLADSGILLSNTALFGDDSARGVRSALRMSVAQLTRRGMGTAAMREVAALVVRAGDRRERATRRRRACGGPLRGPILVRRRALSMTLVFRDVSVADGITPERNHLDVVVEDGAVAAVRPHGGEWPSSDVVAAGGCLAPGLVDGHVHFKSSDADVNRIVALHFLASGVTNVLCMHGHPGVLELRDDVRSGAVPGPTIWTTGPIQNDPNLGYDEGRSSALEQARLGYDGIKVYNGLGLDGFRGLVDGATEAGVPVVGHVVRSVGYSQTLRSYQSHIAHLEEFVYTKLELEMPRLMDPQPIEIDDVAVEQTCADLLENGQSVGTTIEALWSAGHQVRNVDNWCARPDVVRMPAAVRDTWLPPNNEYANRFTDPAHVRAFCRLVRLVGHLAVVLDARGVPLVAGSDALICGVAPGSSMRRELRHLIQAGLPNASAVRAAMAYPLSTAGNTERRIEAGAPADLILLAGDPFRSVASLDGLRGLVRGDRWLSWCGELRSDLRAATARVDLASLGHTG